MAKFNKYCILLLVFLLSGQIIGQDLHFQSYDFNDGLPSNLTKVVTKDHQGFAWIGSDAGLARFDGQQFHSFIKELPSPYVKDVVNDSNNHFLVVTDLGIVRFLSSVDSVKHELLLAGTKVMTDSTVLNPKSIYRDRKNNYWISEPRSVVRYNRSGLKRFLFPSQYLTNSYLRSFEFLETRQGDLLVFSQQGQLLRYNYETDKFLEFKPEKPLPKNFTVNSILIDENDRILMAGPDGLYSLTLDLKELTYRYKNILNMPSITALNFGAKQTILIGTTGEGLYLFKNNQLTKVDGFPCKGINRISNCYDGKNWISSDEGIAIIYPSIFKHVLPYFNLAVHAVDISKDNRVMVTNGSEVFQINPADSDYKAKLLYSTTKSNISSIAADEERLFVGNISGSILMIHPDKREQIELPGRYTVFFQFIDEQGNLWVCRDGIAGIEKITPDLKIQHFTQKHGIKGQLNVIRAHPKGTLYAGGGADSAYLYRYNSKSDRFENISRKIQLNSDRGFEIFDLAINSNGKIWLATSQGLYYSKNEHFHKFNIGRENSVKSLSIDTNDRLWIGTDYGLYCIQKDELIIFDRQDGLNNLTFAFRSAITTPDNRFWIGGLDGLYCLAAPEENTTKSTRPIFLSIHMNNKEVKEKNGQIMTYPHTSFLKAKIVSLVFPSDNIHYQYQLSGFLEDWSSPSKENELLLQNIPSGHYSLKVRARQNGALWSDSATFDFKIDSPWYLSGYSILLYILLLFLAIWVYHAYYRERKKRRLADIALRESEHQLKVVMESSPIFLFSFDTHGKIQLAEGRQMESFGLDKEQLPGASIDDVFKNFSNICKAGREALSGKPYFSICEVNEMYFKISFTPLLNDKGQVTNVIGVANDITATKKAELYAEAANRAKSAFLANMSHEIRTPMNGVLGMTELLLDTPLTAEQRDFINTIRVSGDSLLVIINDILDFSKIESGKLELEKQPFNLRSCLEAAMDLMVPRIAEKDIELLLDLQLDVPETLIGDVTRLRQILVNLMGNAVKFTESGEIKINITQISQKNGMSEIEFEVSDSGIGIPADRMNRLFKSFSQVDESTTREYGGTGLGLAISKRLVELMGGKIWVESEPGIGSKFSFTIKAEIAEQEQTHFSNTFINALKNKRILITDDNKTSSNIIKLLAQKWGMKPTVFPDGFSALAQLRSGMSFDVGLLDLHMPKMDGIEFSKKIHEIPECKNLPLILLSTFGQPKLENPADEAQFRTIILKPVKQSQLLNALGNIFERRKVHDRGSSREVILNKEIVKNNPLTILLAEDNRINQKLAIRLLEKMGYQPDVADNGAAALAAWEKSKHDVILMDVQMPLLDGFETTRQIRLKKESSQPFIIAMTAHAIQGYEQKCLDGGMDAYISKPVKVDKLLALLSSVKSNKPILKNQ